MAWGKQQQRPPQECQEPVNASPNPPSYDADSKYNIDSTDTPYRYAAYANRARTILLSAHRYVAYTSDIGESFRPVVHPYLVRTAYGISWTYVIGDVAHEGYKAYQRNRAVLADNAQSQSQSSAVPLIDDYRLIMAKRMTFQSLASMGFPALTIHSVVKYSGKMLRNAKTAFVRTWAPIGLGLSVVPFLPYVFDKPVEEAVEWSFREALRACAGEDAVRSLSIPSEGSVVAALKDAAPVVSQIETETKKNPERAQGNGRRHYWEYFWSSSKEKTE